MFPHNGTVIVSNTREAPIGRFFIAAGEVFPRS
jgi:hypothetical protein